MKDDYTANSHYLTWLQDLKRLGESSILNLGAGKGNKTYPREVNS